MTHPFSLLLAMAALAIVCPAVTAQTEAPPAPVDIQELAEQAAQGNRSAQYNLAVQYFRGDLIERDYVKAAALWRQAAEQGSVLAMNNLGYLLFEGLAGKADPEQGVALWLRAAQAGVAESHMHLGFAAEYGEGAALDLVEAYARYRAAVMLASRADDEANRSVLEDARTRAETLKPQLNADQRRAAEEKAQRYVANVSPAAP